MFFINNIIMNIKSLFITSGISFIFGMYSVFNILEYLRVLNNQNVKQIHNLQTQLDDTNKKFNDLNIKDIELQKMYDELLVNYERINEELTYVNIQVSELQEHKFVSINIPSNSYSSTKPEIVINDNTICDNTICEHLCNLNNVPKNLMETMLENYTTIDDEFVESLSFAYDCDETTELFNNNTEPLFMCNSEKNSIKPIPRSVSVTEINWEGLFKKFLFG